MDNTNTKSDQHIWTLEPLRFIAAVLVFFGHYVHFYMHYGIPEQSGVFFSINNQDIGGLAVPMFFLMSGAIFSQNYGNSIISRKISVYEFMWKRIARLYPLALAKLLITAILQYLIKAKTSNYFIYESNDTYNFILHSLFISDWGFQEGVGYNGPVWSVSHEIFLYFCFIFVCVLARISKTNEWIFIAAFLVIYLAQKFGVSNPLLKSGAAFFCGAAINFFFRTFCEKASNKLLLVRTAGMVVVLIILHRLFSSVGLPQGAAAPLLVVTALVANSWLATSTSETFIQLKSAARKLGDLTYSSYLLHFPIQLVLVLISAYLVPLDFSSIGVLSIYIFLVLFSSKISFNNFETPFRRKMVSYGEARWFSKMRLQSS